MHLLREQFVYGIRTHVGGVSELGALRFDEYVIVQVQGAAQLGL